MVINRAGLELPRQHYDVLIIGAGMLGLSCAFYLRKLLPDTTLLIAEQDGVPSELGMSFASPALFSSFELDEVHLAKASWAYQRLQTLEKETGVSRPHDLAFQQVGALTFEKTNLKIDYPSHLTQEKIDAVQTIINPDVLRLVNWEASAGFGSAEAVALHYGYGAVQHGADLLLNTRVSPLSETTFRLERLEFDRYMRQVVVKTERLTAEVVIVAAGASSPGLLEGITGNISLYRRVYQQYPRLEFDKRLPVRNGQVDLPVIHACGFSFRPQGEGLLIMPPALPADPEGYEPVGAQLMGVRIGLRREVLEQLMTYADYFPVMNWDSLNLGKTVQKVRGCWQLSLTYPEWRQLTDKVYVLLGGEQGFSLGLAIAYDLAARLAQESERPWEGSITSKN